MFQNLLENSSWIQCLTPQQLQELKSHTSQVSFDNNDILVKQNSHTSSILLLVEGIAKMHLETRKGKHIIVKLCKAGCFLGIDNLINSNTFSCSFSGITPTTVIYIDYPFFQRLLSENPTFAKEIMHTISDENRFLISRLAALSYKQLPGKLADILLYFSQVIYNSNTFCLPLSRQELAEFAGTTKESLIRTLTEFKNDKLITVQGKNITINSQPIIETLSKLG
ncbi:MAG TPA: Crp/Fnr family transcriptional regulator [Williamwhitmania sp.]|nr:Crp/Fnr family transcriptional regulator [Williamwhitmania sp.]